MLGASSMSEKQAMQLLIVPWQAVQFTLQLWHNPLMDTWLDRHRLRQVLLLWREKPEAQEEQ